jgi:ribosome-associated protein
LHADPDRCLLMRSDINCQGDSRLPISARVSIPLTEIEIKPIHAQGAGGQNVNRVASAVHLRFAIRDSSLPDLYKQRLLSHADRRITSDGVVVIKAQEHRTQEKNRAAALVRLQALVRAAAATRKPRRPTQPTRAARQRRIEGKKRRGRDKRLRRRLPPGGESD